MKPKSVRSWLHNTNVTLAIILTLTGAFIMFPDLRAAVIGGYGRELGVVHLWVGWAFILFPLGFLLKSKMLWQDTMRRLTPKTPVKWRKINLGFTLAFVALINITGLVLWLDEWVSLFVLDAALWVHQALTYIFMGTFAVHLWASRRGIMTRLRQWFGGKQPSSATE